MKNLMKKIAGEIAEKEVERRIGKWLAVEIVHEDGTELLTEEAQEIYDEVYSEALRILTNNLVNQ